MEGLLIRIVGVIRATSETVFDPKLLIAVVTFFWAGLIVQVLALSPRQKEGLRLPAGRT